MAVMIECASCGDRRQVGESERRMALVDPTATCRACGASRVQSGDDVLDGPSSWETQDEPKPSPPRKLTRVDEALIAWVDWGWACWPDTEHSRFVLELHGRPLPLERWAREAEQALREGQMRLMLE